MERQTIARKSWVAYLLLVTARLALTGISMIVAAAFIDPIAGGLAGLIGLATIIYGVFWLKTFELFMDENGVWLYHGILPWKKGINGIKWRDIGGCLYETGFSSWVTKSAAVTVEHRFTRTSSLSVSEMAKAKAAAGILARALSEHRS